MQLQFLNPCPIFPQWYVDSGQHQKSTRQRALYSDRQSLKIKVMSLINLAVSPEMTHPIRLRMVKTLCYEPNIDLLLKYLLQGNPTQVLPGSMENQRISIYTYSVQLRHSQSSNGISPILLKSLHRQLPSNRGSVV